MKKTKEIKDEKAEVLFSLLREIALKQEESKTINKEIADLYRETRKELDIQPGDNTNLQGLDVAAKITWKKTISADPVKIHKILNGPNKEVAKVFRECFEPKLSYTTKDIPALLKAAELNGDVKDAVEWSVKTKYSAAQIAANMVVSEEEIE